MIIDYIDNAEIYCGVSEEIKIALQYLVNHTELAERFDLSDRVNIKIESYTTLSENERKWEAHDHLIDIHYAVDGEEDICWDSRKNMVFTKQEEGKDVLRFSGEGTRFTLKKGMFMIVFPDDVHKTKLYHDAPTQVLKGLAKIKL